MTVTHCICYDRAIADIVAEAKGLNLITVDEVVAAIPCGDKCGLCVPYIAVALDEIELDKIPHYRV